MISSNKAITLSEILLVVSIIAMATVMIIYGFRHVGKSKTLSSTKNHAPSPELEFIASILVDEIYSKGNTEWIDEVFAKDYKVYNPVEPYTEYNRKLFKLNLQDIHLTHFDYNPNLLRIEYNLNRNIILFWTCGVFEYGIPKSVNNPNNSNNLGISIFEIKNGKIAKSNHGNIYYSDSKQLDRLQ